MRLLNIVIFLICYLLYLLNESILKNLNNLFFTGYYNDILAPILLLSYSNFLLSKYKKNLIGTKSFIFILVCSIIWEFFAPLIREGSVIDPFDFVAYLFGCFLYNVIYKFITNKIDKNNKVNIDLKKKKSKK